MYKPVCLVVLLAMIGCQTSTSSADPQLGEEFELGLGEQVNLDNQGLSITFNELLEDSRCPKGVTCFWAGNAKVALQINEHEATLNSNLEPRQTTIYSYQVALISVSPYPIYMMDFQKEDYIVRLVITEN